MAMVGDILTIRTTPTIPTIRTTLQIRVIPTVHTIAVFQGQAQVPTRLVLLWLDRMHRRIPRGTLQRRRPALT